MKHVLKVEAGDAGVRVDRFVGDRLSLSRSALKALFEGDGVRVGGRRVKKGDSLEAGQLVEVEHTPAARHAQADPAVPLSVLFEDEAVVAIDKPASMPCHPLKPGETNTVANALLARYPELAQVGGDPREAGLCHRLDVETSGVLLAARTPAAYRTLRDAFSTAGAVDKRYLALVAGPLEEKGVIELALAHSGDHVRATTTAEGRPARSEFAVLARRGPHALVEVRLVTGVLHQVRAHLAAIGAPIVGDALYDGPAVEGLGRFFLHAASVTVSHPTTHRPLAIAAPLPDALTEVLQRLVPGAKATPGEADRRSGDRAPSTPVT